VALIAETAGKRRLAPRIVETIVGRSDGIPLFVEEIAKAVIEAPSTDSAVPMTLHDSLLARLDAAQSVDEDLLPRNHRLAVWIARVVDEAGVSTTCIRGSVNDRVLVEREQEGVMALHLRVIVAAICLIIVDVLSRVLQNPRSLADVAESEDAVTVDVRRAHDVQGLAPIP